MNYRNSIKYKLIEYISILEAKGALSLKHQKIF